MFKDIFIIQNNEQLHVYNYFNREQIDTINVGDYIEIMVNMLLSQVK